MVFPFCIIGAQLIASGLVLAFSNPHNMWAVGPANTNLKVDDVVGSSHTGWKCLPFTLWASLPKTRDALPWWAPVIGFALVVMLMMAMFVAVTLQESPALRELRATFAREDAETGEDETEDEGEDEGGGDEEEGDVQEAFPREHRAAYLAGYRRGYRARAREARDGERRANPDHSGAAEQEEAGEAAEGGDVSDSRNRRNDHQVENIAVNLVGKCDKARGRPTAVGSPGWACRARDVNCVDVDLDGDKWGTLSKRRNRRTLSRRRR